MIFLLLQIVVLDKMMLQLKPPLHKNTNPEVCRSRDNGVLRRKNRKKS